MADSFVHAGTKRPHSSSLSEPQPHKKRRILHKLRRRQHMPQHVEAAPQDPVFAQGQLLRSITGALALAGFDSVKPTALEMFRSHTEEYMLRFATSIRSSMQAQRRTVPTAQDFAVALALTPNTASASLLQPQLDLQIPEGISYPSIPEPVSPEAPAPDLSSLLQPLTGSKPRDYIPKHFPPLPPTHAWEQTPVFPSRETDARKMREKATQEGMLAEQALRKLASAAKAGAMKVEKRRSGAALSGPGKARQRAGAGQKRLRDEYDSFAEAMRDVGGVGVEGDGEGDLGMGMDGAGDAAGEGVDVGMPEGVAVNYDMGHWRHGGSRKALRS